MTGDPIRDAYVHDNEMERWLLKYPTCCKCGEHIQPYDRYLDMDGELICEDCLYGELKVMEAIE